MKRHLLQFHRATGGFTLVELPIVIATAATSGMSAFPSGNLLCPSRIRLDTAKGTYAGSPTGLVTQATTGY